MLRHVQYRDPYPTADAPAPAAVETLTAPPAQAAARFESLFGAGPPCPADERPATFTALFDRIPGVRPRQGRSVANPRHPCFGRTPKVVRVRKA